CPMERWREYVFPKHCNPLWILTALKQPASLKPSSWHCSSSDQRRRYRGRWYHDRRKGHYRRFLNIGLLLFPRACYVRLFGKEHHSRRLPWLPETLQTYLSRPASVLVSEFGAFWHRPA